jgi:hypothetical protein
MSCLLLLMDVAPNPVETGSFAVVILLLVVIMGLAVAFAAGLVFLLIWLKRRKTKVTEIQPETPIV